MKSVILIFWLLGVMGFEVSGQSSELQCGESEDYMLTHLMVPAGPIPTALDPNGVYPYESYSGTSERPVLKKYRFIDLENSFMKVRICPDLGGKIMSMVLKHTNTEILYKPDVIRPVRILPRFSFVAGGIEVSFPISHSPSQNEQLVYRIDREETRIYVTCGEKELRFGMQWSVEYSLGRDDHWLTERVVYKNAGSRPNPWMSWSNAAIESAPGTRFDFPDGIVLSHSSVIDTIDWKMSGPRYQSDIREMTGYFWLTKNVNAFGVFTPSLGKGLYHIAEESVAPGIKLWSYGAGADSSWAMLSTATQKPYIEIQAGPLGNQSIKAELKPGEIKWHAEYWFPADQPMDIQSMKVPPEKLREIRDIPLFGWARPETVQPWLELVKSSASGEKVPVPPAIELCNWPPSGLEGMSGAFEWAIKNAPTADAEIWRFYYGAWLAGSGESGKATEVLAAGRIGMSKTLLGRLLRMKGDYKGAAAAYREIKEPWLQLHPQVIIERDIVLRKLGRETLSERRAWLEKVNALQDEWIIERKVQLLIDESLYKEAKNLLLSTRFQRVHQTYTRTELWRQITSALHEPFLPIPDHLGEDRLARFGAYREYE